MNLEKGCFLSLYGLQVNLGGLKNSQDPASQVRHTGRSIAGLNHALFMVQFSEADRLEVL